jgi:hypothetical protein
MGLKQLLSSSRVISTLMLFLIMLGLYWATAAQFVLGGDNGEFLTVGTLGGVPHPSGYPLTALYLRVMNWMPGVSPAHSASLAIGLVGAVSVVVLRNACVRWGASENAAIVAASVWGTTGLAWTAFTHAEVFALHALVAAAILSLSAPLSPLRGLQRVLLLALLAGLGLSNNHTAVTLAPIGLWGAAYGVLEVRRAREVGVGKALLLTVPVASLGLAAGLLPYLYLVTQAGSEVWAWGDTASWSGLLHHFLRGDYGTTSLAISDNSASALHHVGTLMQSLLSQLHGVFFVAALAGFVVLLSERGSRRFGVALLLAFLVAGPVLISRFNLPLDGLSEGIVARFYLLPLTVLVVPVALGLDAACERFRFSTHWLLPIAVAFSCGGVFRWLDDVRSHHADYVETYLVDTIRSMPPNGVLLGVGDQELFGFLYVQEVLNQRPDVVVINMPMLAYDWYRVRTETALGFEIAGVIAQSCDEPGESCWSIDSVSVVASLFQHGRQVALTTVYSDAIARELIIYPLGTLIMVTTASRPPPSPAVLEEMNRNIIAHYQIPVQPPASAKGWSAYVWRRYGNAWQQLSAAYVMMGRVDDAARCQATADLYRFPSD